MKCLALLTAGLFSLTCIPSLSAQEVTFRSSAWDSIAPILDVTEYYLTVKDARKTQSVRLNLEVYRKGQKEETIFGPGVATSQEASPIDLKAAILFRHEEGKPGKGYLSMEWRNTECSQRVDIDQTKLPMAKGRTAAAFGSSKWVEDKMPVFYLLLKPDDVKTSGVKSARTPEELLELNPECVVVIGMLVVDFLHVD